MIKKEILTHLLDALNYLVGLLRLDTQCQWTEKFERDREEASRLLGNGFTDQDIASLSISIRYVYQGMGSFNDYSPGTYNPSTGRYEATCDAGDFEEASRRVYELATKLSMAP